MLDEIYPRLFLEILPEDIKKDSPEYTSLSKLLDSNESTRASYGKLLSTVYRQDVNSNIGLQFGKYLGTQAICDCSLLVATSIDVRAAFEFIENKYHMHGASYCPFTLLKNGVFSLALTFPFKCHTSDNQKRFCAESVFSYMVNALTYMTQQNFKPLQVCFDFPKPKYINEYKLMFGDNIKFDAPLNLIEFDESYLSKTLSTSNSTLHNMYLEKSEYEWRKICREKNYFIQVVITRMLRFHPASFQCESLAQMMNLSVRGLQKKLGQHDLTFSQISNLVRRELAKIYLIQEKQTLNKTADKLGFQSLSGFTRFFKAEFNLSPTEYIRASIN